MVNLSRIKLITYNVGDKSAEANKPDELFNFVQLRKFDFIFIGLQEVSNDASWTSLIKKKFGEHDYVLIKMRNIWAIWLYALVKRSRLSQIDNVESEITASGYAGVLGNKGGVSIRFKYQGMSLIVVNGHFTAHEEGFKDRLNDYLDILMSQLFRDPDVNNILDHDLIFWMGDLNFRIENLSKDEIEKCINEKNYSMLLENEQLIRAIGYHELFKDFREGPLNFPPTFKFDNQKDTYDTSKKKRKPAWTDRILYMYQTDDQIINPSIELIRYYSEQNIRGSDHRPVCGEFKVTFNPLKRCWQLPIQFDEITKSWNCIDDQIALYRMTETNDETYEKYDNNNEFKPDRWDWIALVPSNWCILHQDLITYVYVTSVYVDELYGGAQVEFKRKFLTEIHSKKSLQLVYYSRQKNCIQGISNVFPFE